MKKIKLAAVGDIMLGDHPVCFGHGIRSHLRKGRSLIAPALSKFIQAADLSIGNLECVLSDIGHDEGQLSSSEMRGDQNAVQVLKSCGFNVLSVANNHMLQHGEKAFFDTVQWLEKNGIKPVGLYAAGQSNISCYEKDAVKIALIGYSLRPEWFCKDNKFYASASHAQIIQQVQDIRKNLPEHNLVISLHWGEEYLHVPSGDQIQFAHALIDSGVSVVIGHHPHVLQGIEKYRDGLIAYSLGNFIFDSWQLPTRESLVLTCEFSERGLEGYEVTPIQMQKNYSLKIAEGEDKERLLQNLLAYSQAIVGRDGLAALDNTSYGMIANKRYFRYRMECYVYFLTHLWKYKFNVVAHSLFRALLRRVGLA